MRTSDRIVAVTCKIRTAQPDYDAVNDIRLRRAAEATVAAGKTHFIPAGSEWQAVEADGTTTSTNCLRYPLLGGWGGMKCTSRQAHSRVVGYTSRHTFELLDADEADARAAAELPEDRQPQDARAILASDATDDSYEE